MRELTMSEVHAVSGGWEIDPMQVAISYSSTVIGAGVGLTIAGPAGGIAGAVIGFGAGLAMSIGYSMGSSYNNIYDNGMSCYMPPSS